RRHGRRDLSHPRCRGITDGRAAQYARTAQGPSESPSPVTRGKPLRTPHSPRRLAEAPIADPQSAAASRRQESQQTAESCVQSIKQLDKQSHGRVNTNNPHGAMQRGMLAPIVILCPRWRRDQLRLQHQPRDAMKESRLDFQMPGYARFRWPKAIPQLPPELQAVSDDWMHQWLEVLPKRYGMLVNFNQTYPLRFLPEHRPFRTLEIGAGIGTHLAYEDLSLQEYHCIELRENVGAKLRERFPTAIVTLGDCQQKLPY